MKAFETFMFGLIDEWTYLLGKEQLIGFLSLLYHRVSKVHMGISRSKRQVRKFRSHEEMSCMFDELHAMDRSTPDGVCTPPFNICAGSSSKVRIRITDRDAEGEQNALWTVFISNIDLIRTQYDEKAKRSRRNSHRTPPH